MNEKTISSIGELILPAGVLYILYRAVSGLFPGSFPGPDQNGPIPGQVGETTTQCPRGNKYPKPLLGACFPGYHQEGSFPDPSNCVCDALQVDQPPAIPDSGSGSVFVENIPTLRMCQQVWDTQKQWPSECILAGYPAPQPEVIPDSISPFTGKPWYCGTTPYAPGCL